MYYLHYSSSMSSLKDKKCIPCSGKIPALSLKEKKRLLEQLHGHWKLTHDNTRLLRGVKFNSFVEPLKLTNEIGEIAEEQNHHPELVLGWGHLEIEIWTHKIGDLVESDFIFASKVDEKIEEAVKKQ